MIQRIKISLAYNLALGFLPAALTILLGEFITKDYAIYTGALVGVVYSLLNYYKSAALFPNYILYLVTAILVILSGISAVNLTDWPKNSLPITLEIIIVVLLLIVSFNKTLFINSLHNRVKETTKRHIVEAGVASIITIRLLIILAFVHFAVLTIMVLFTNTLGDTTLWVMQSLIPLLVFIITIIINQIGVNIFNQIASDSVYLPIVNDKGDVTGKVLRESLFLGKEKPMVPIIRVAIIHQGMLLLSPDSLMNSKATKTDSPLKTFIIYEESIEDTVNRLTKESFPGIENLDPRFSIKYKYINADNQRLVYLFILDIADENHLKQEHFAHAKLWTLNQMEDNLGKNFFSNYLENEFEHLKDIIEIREKYRVS